MLVCFAKCALALQIGLPLKSRRLQKQSSSLKERMAAMKANLKDLQQKVKTHSMKAVKRSKSTATTATGPTTAPFSGFNSAAFMESTSAPMATIAEEVATGKGKGFGARLRRTFSPKSKSKPLNLCMLPVLTCSAVCCTLFEVCNFGSLLLC